MNSLIDALASLSTAPLGALLALVALGAIGLAVFAIYVVHSTINDRERLCSSGSGCPRPGSKATA